MSGGIGQDGELIYALPKYIEKASTKENLRLFIDNLDNKAYLKDNNGIVRPFPCLSSEYIQIPEPIIKVNKGLVRLNTNIYNQSLSAYYLPFSSAIKEEFLNHNPKFYLFRQCSSKNKKRANEAIIHRPKGFYHPTHLNGINFPVNTPVYGGSTRIPMNTEYDLVSLKPYNNTQLNFNPFEFIEYSADLNTWVPMTDQLWDNPPINYRFTGKKLNKRYSEYGSTSSKSILFKIAIGIKNPNGSNTNPILFGNFSDVFRLSFSYRYGVFYNYNIDLQTSSVPRKKTV